MSLTTSLVALSNESIVYRSANLNPDIYGLEFSHHQYLPIPNLFSAIFVHFLTKLGILLLAPPFIRWMLRKLSFEPGSGPDREHNRSVESAEYTAIGNSGNGKIRAKARFYYKGSLVDISAILAVVAAGVLLDRSIEGERRGEELKGGYLTPSTLGMVFVERLREVGVELEVEELLQEVSVGIAGKGFLPLEF
jgi:short subunit dehydrogenase-like uncharacterized protein